MKNIRSLTMFRDFDEVKLWAPSIKKTQNATKAVERGQDLGNKEDLPSSYQPPPLIWKRF